jgi:CRP/FNR family cyclic AMP-dependent transcriptional regulator
MSRPTQQFIKGQTILLEGTPGDRSFRILAGEVVVCKRNSANQVVPIARLGAGEIFGEMYLFSDNRNRSATVVAGSEVMVEVIHQHDMRNELGRISPALHSILDGFSQRLRIVSSHCAEVYEGRKPTRLPGGNLRRSGTRIGC